MTVWPQVRRALVRFWLTARLRPRSTSELVRLGSAYGGWWVPRRVLQPGAVCICLGAGEDITFDAELCERHGATVVTADPTPRAIAHVREHTPRGDFRFLPVGIAGTSGVRRFYSPADPAHVSHSIANLQGTDDYFEAECITLPQLLVRADVDRIDLLKLDIEGAEHETIASLVSSHVRPSVVCIEFDQPAAIRTMNVTIGALSGMGFEAVKVDRFNVTFVR